jgi:hypothetical protein
VLNCVSPTTQDPPNRSASDSGSTDRCPDSSGWLQIVAGASSSCGIHPDGCVECWGYGKADAEEMSGKSDFDYAYNGDHEIPDAHFTKLSMPRFAPQLSMSQHVCGIAKDGRFLCWGALEVESTPSSGAEFIDLSSYTKEGACVLESTGTLRCWEPELRLLDGVYNEIDGALQQCARPLAPELPMECWSGDQIQPFLSVEGTALRVGYNGYCTVDDESQLKCKTFAKAPYLEFDGRPLPPGYRDYCMKPYSLCLLDADGRISCDDDELNRPPTDSGYTELSCANGHVCAVHESGSGVCWGGDSWGNTTVP